MQARKFIEWVEMASFGINKVVEYLVTVALMALFLLIAGEVFGRNFLGTTMAWMMEGVGFLLAFITFVGISAQIYKRRVLTIEFIRERVFVSRNAQIAFNIFSSLVLIGYAYVLVTEGLAFAVRGASRFTPSRQFNLYHMRLILPLGGALILLEGVLNLVKDIARLAGVDIGPSGLAEEEVTETHKLPAAAEAGTALDSVKKSDETDSGL